MTSPRHGARGGEPTATLNVIVRVICYFMSLWMVTFSDDVSYESSERIMVMDEDG